MKRAQALILFSVLLLLLLPGMALAASITVDKDNYAVSEELTLTINLPGAESMDGAHYVLLYADAPHTDWLELNDWAWVTRQSMVIDTKTAPRSPGHYEYRLFSNRDASDATLVDVASFTVGAVDKQGQISLNKEVYQVGEAINVTVTGISPTMEASRAWVGVYHAGDGHSQWTPRWDYVPAGDSEVTITALTEAGDYEMRLYTAHGVYNDETFVTSVPFSVVGEAVEPPVSDWARPEIDKAADLGLIPDSLAQADSTRPITRAEFAAVAVKLYENLVQIPATAGTNPFRDTTDAEVVKAYNLGITDGVAADRFAPAELLNREQAATMLTRVFKRAFVADWALANDSQFAFDYTRPAAFADDNDISAWAKPSVYFMVAHNIIEGVGGNRFVPKAVTSAQQAEGYATATREQALAIAVRMTENLDAGDAGKIVPAD